MAGAIGTPCLYTLPNAVSRSKSEPSIDLVGPQRCDAPCVYIDSLRLQRRDPGIFGAGIIRKSALQEFSIPPRRLFEKSQETASAAAIAGSGALDHRADQQETTADFL